IVFPQAPCGEIAHAQKSYGSARGVKKREGSHPADCGAVAWAEIATIGGGENRISHPRIDSSRTVRHDRNHESNRDEENVLRHHGEQHDLSCDEQCDAYDFPGSGEIDPRLSNARHALAERALPSSGTLHLSVRQDDIAGIAKPDVDEEAGKAP